GTCILCPYMKEIQLDDILQALKDPTPDQRIEIPHDVADRARASLTNMFELEQKGRELLNERR
ncbi:MAG: quinolinate synthase NadA, partial [bacterium]|nr:quinolinate synthase NadA [bacterium]